MLIAAYAVGHISGGHFNPAVSLGAAAAGRMRWADVCPYIIAQIVGGLLATAAALADLGDAERHSPPTSGSVVQRLRRRTRPAASASSSVIIAEIVATAVFVWVILGVTAPGSTTAGFAPLASASP